MPLVTPTYGPGFPYRVGMLLFNGVQNGQQIYVQPGGIGTPVVPQAPQVNPPPSWKNSNWLPKFPYVYVGLLSWGCKHWTNTCEVYRAFDNYSGESAALLCCPTCSYIGYIVEPYEEWEESWFSVYPTGIVQAGYIPSPPMG